MFPHPNIRFELNRIHSHKLLDLFPEAKHLIDNWASENIKILTSERLAEYVRSDEFSIELYTEHFNDCELNQFTSMSFVELKDTINVESFSVYSTWKL